MAVGIGEQWEEQELKTSQTTGGATRAAAITKGTSWQRCRDGIVPAGNSPNGGEYGRTLTGPVSEKYAVLMMDRDPQGRADFGRFE